MMYRCMRCGEPLNTAGVCVRCDNNRRVVELENIPGTGVGSGYCAVAPACRFESCPSDHSTSDSSEE